ncbi:MAG: hypothetical protein HBSAPP02_15360 [Phycisphaerae bacterium]|nr:MAG: hypothetical protein HBSAPP02_15360 [Phycisphaerae bacterium]
MTRRLYPISLAELANFARELRVTTEESRKRFVQYVVLQAISASPLRDVLIFKGGNALRFVYANRRGTMDLDFTATSALPDDKPSIGLALDSAFVVAFGQFGVKLRYQSAQRNPPGADKHFPTYEVKVGYQFPGDRYFPEFDARAQPVSSVVDLEISLNDVVCDDALIKLDPQRDLCTRVCSVEDIVAEKLRALLQQRVRKRHRKQDAYDIASMLRMHRDQINPERVTQFFLRKAKARGINPSRSMFDDEIRRRASCEYETLFDDERDPYYIPFDQAWDEVIRLVHALDIPP